MSFISPEFQLVELQDVFISLLYADKKKKTTSGEAVEVTDEINDYLILPHINAKYQVKQMEQAKFSKNILHLATLPDKRRLVIQEDGTLVVK